jgi:hypothetical protein
VADVRSLRRDSRDGRGMEEAAQGAFRIKFFARQFHKTTSSKYR